MPERIYRFYFSKTVPFHYKYTCTYVLKRVLARATHKMPLLHFMARAQVGVISKLLVESIGEECLPIASNYDLLEARCLRVAWNIRVLQFVSSSTCHSYN
ncbi:hypothetical protein ACTXT7_000580 [Hymenolepis weldensis]